MAICELQLLLKHYDPDLKFHHLNNHVWCFPHIINICMSHVIVLCTWVSKEYLESLRYKDDDDILFSSLNIENDNDNNNDDDNNDGNDSNSDNDNDNNDIAFFQRTRQHIPRLKLKNIKLDGLGIEEVAWFLNIKCNPIKHTCRVIHILCLSDQRKQDFKQVIKNGNESGWFQNVDNSAITVPDMELLHNIKTQWDSTFTMIEHLLVLQQVSAKSFQSCIWV